VFECTDDSRLKKVVHILLYLPLSYFLLYMDVRGHGGSRILALLWIGKASPFYDACTWCLHSAGIYCHVLLRPRTSLNFFVLQVCPCWLASILCDTYPSPSFRTDHLQLYAFVAKFIVMRWLWCFKFKAANRRSTDRRNDYRAELQSSF